MDPSRSPPSLKRRRVSPSSVQTSLPSIRQLHPYLPPSSQQSLSPEIPPYAYPSPYSSQLPHSDPSSHRDPAMLVPDSEPDDLDLQNPPKKKRRRQALSCTECKRRKIKCDRIQPCTPCSRRGEESGCQWHIVEPIEKYVTKAEFDHLKARYEQLEAFVRRYLPIAPSAPPSVTYYAMGVQPGMSGIVGDPVSSYGSGTSSMIYNPVMMPPPPPPPPQSQSIYQQHQQQHQQQQLSETSQAAQSTASRYLRTDAAAAMAQSPTTRHTNFSANLGMVGPSASSPIIPTNLQAAASGHHQHQHHRPLPRVSTEGMTTTSPPIMPMKTSPLSLASITSPYHPDHHQQSPQIQGGHQQSKNYHAQTLRLGERLRLGREGPKNFIDMSQRVALVVAAVVVQPAVAQVKGRRCLPPRRCRCLPTPFRLENSPRLIGLRIQLVALRVCQVGMETGNNGALVELQGGRD